MSYTKHTWASGDTLTAAQMNEISEELESTQQNIPTKLASPHPLNFTGGATGSYDGSQAITINIPAAGSGERGEPGTSVSITSVSESTADGGSNVVTFSDGTTLTIKNGSKGSQGLEGKAGEAGARGPQGEQGIQGEKGEKGDKGDKGDTGAQGPQGPKGDKGDTGDGTETISSDIAAACDSIVTKVNGVLKSDSIIFIAGSDAHQLDSNSNIVTGNKHAGQAMGYLAKKLPGLDFACYLGDYTWGSNSAKVNPATYIYEGLRHIREINADIDSAFEGIPQFRTTGNHDGLYYSESQNGAVLSSKDLFGYIGKYCDGMVYGDESLGYGYRDFEYAKLRVICLNTAEGGGSSAVVGDAQKTWFVNTALGGVKTKEDWKIVILSHHPLDWPDAHKLGNALYDFVEDSSTKARVIAQFHGHVHCFTVDNLNYISGGAGTPYQVKRIATPNMCFLRNNDYGTNGATEYFGIEFGETTTYNKTANGVNDTAFVVNVINPSEEMIYSFCYGAGYDRTVSYAKETIAVTGVTVSPTSLSLEVGNTGTVTATVSPFTATNKTVTWTSSAPTIASVSNGIVTAKAAGSATITATTQDGSFRATCTVQVTTPAPSYTNVLSNLRDPGNAKAVFNGVGYMNDTYASAASPFYGSDAATVCLGCILRDTSTQDTSAPLYTFNGTDAIYIKGLTFGSSRSRVALVNNSNLATTNRGTYNISTDPAVGSTVTLMEGAYLTKLADKYYKFVVTKNAGSTDREAVYFSGIADSGANVIVTINEPIE